MQNEAMQKEVPPAIVIAAIILILGIVGFMVYKTITGGVQGDGQEGRVMASPTDRGIGNRESMEKMMRDKGAGANR